MTADPATCTPRRYGTIELGRPDYHAQTEHKCCLVVVGEVTWEAASNPVSLVEIAVEKNASTTLIPFTARKQLNGLSDEMATRIQIVFYRDARDALIKAVQE